MKISFNCSTAILLMSSLKSIIATTPTVTPGDSATPAATPAPVAAAVNPLSKIREDLKAIDGLVSSLSSATEDDKIKLNEQISAKSKELSKHIAPILKDNISFYRDNKDLTVEKIESGLLDTENDIFIENAAIKVNEAHKKGNEFMVELYNILDKCFRGVNPSDRDPVSFFENKAIFPKSNSQGLFEKFKNPEYKLENFLTDAKPILEDINAMKGKTGDVQKEIESKASFEFIMIIVYAVVDLLLVAVSIYLLMTILKGRKEGGAPVVNEVMANQQFQ